MKIVKIREYDTITAIATGVVESGISIIRLSGKDSLKIVCSIFDGKNGRKLQDIKHYTLRYGYIINKNNNEIIDEVLVSYMKAPHSYTAEDTIEVNCHGGILAANRILEEIIKAGARIAQPGEFTKRAFLNGRIDLTQAEAVIDIIRAKTDLAMKVAVMQAEGSISREIKSLRNDILKIIAHIEATVDFPEDDLEEITCEEVSAKLKSILISIDKFLNTADEGKIIREGLDIVIVGKPNVGKSSIFNTLLKESRSIVTEIPGTTRDVIEEYINLEGIAIKITDTAGIRDTQDIVEKMGVQKTKERIENADLIMMMVDSSLKLTPEDIEILDYIKNRKYILILNKSDLQNNMDFKINIDKFQDIDSKYIIKVSALTGQGIGDLKNLIKNMFFSSEIKSKELYITNKRHKESLIRARENCILALDTLKNTTAIDLASIDLRDAWTYLGEITGETLQENIIDKIFSEFCIGK